ncbi:DUF202 domain-containing protein [Isoptericola aurantiacus]|uniref:DUF202 domain-containing protein n=1 Tax=Isoptericola aurantiacus TaxID=3377839 RepID=UPI00383B7763
MKPPWDQGLQPERTELAWRRTVLATTAGTAVAARYLGASQPVLGLVLPLLALLGGLAMLRTSTVRFRRLTDALHTAGPAPTVPVMPGGGMLAVVTVAALLIAVVSAVFVITHAVS